MKHKVPLKNTIRQWSQSSKSACLIPWFIHTFKIRSSEAELPISAYTSLEHFFTRRLKADSRPFEADPEVICSPVDGRLSVVSKVLSDTRFYVKDKPYRLTDLFDDDVYAQMFIGGVVMVLYLSPADYHRIHLPLKATQRMVYEKGGFSWPVNDWGLKHVKEVLTKNYRLISLFDTERFTFAMVSVGALNVNSVIRSQPEKRQYDKMEEYAYFSFGSTVVLVFPAGVIEGEFTFRTVKAGESLARIHA